MRTLGLVLAAITVMGVVHTQGFAIARLLKGDPTRPPTKNSDIPDKVRNCIVRIRRETSYINRASGGLLVKNYAGTGIIVSVERRDTDYKLLILSADHVLRPVKRQEGEEFDTDYYFDFGDGDEENWPERILFNTSISRVPLIAEKATDMALIAASVPHDKLPPIEVPKIMAVEKSKELILAGCGNSASEIGRDRDGWYMAVTENKTGKYRSGPATIDKLVPDSQFTDAATGTVYQFAGIDSRMAFEIKESKVVAATAFSTSGDSGGPAFQREGDNWYLVGIHANSLILDGKIRQDNPQTMVNILGREEYREWLKKNKIEVPEKKP